MANEVFDALLRYHREVLMPEVRDVLREEVGAVRGEMHSLADGIYVRLDRVESEIQSLKAGLQ